jgi:hypothetical protein
MFVRVGQRLARVFEKTCVNVGLLVSGDRETIGHLGPRANRATIPPLLLIRVGD